MIKLLTDAQMYTLMQHSPELDEVSVNLSPSLQSDLLDLEKRVGATYAAGEWIRQNTGEKHNVILAVAPPSVEETQNILGRIYLGLDEQKKSVKNLMDEMGMTPTALRKNWIEKIVDDVQGWFR